MSFSEKYDPSLIALGPDSSYFALFKNGSTSWSGIPIWLHNKLRGRQRSLPPVSLLSLGPSHEAFVQFEDGKCNWSMNDDDEFASTVNSHTSRITNVAFGPDGGWFIRFADGHCNWNNLPSKLVNRLQGRQRYLPHPKQMSFDDDGGYFVKFEDGGIWWGSLNSNVNELLESNDPPKRLILGCGGDYFAFSSGGVNACAWRVDKTLERDLGFPSLAPDDIRYTQKSIGQSFADRDNYTIYDLAHDLACGSIDANVDIPAIRVVQDEDGAYWSLDNRRLWAFNQAGLEKVRVQLVERGGDFDRKKRKVQDGWSIRVRG